MSSKKQSKVSQKVIKFLKIISFSFLSENKKNTKSTYLLLSFLLFT